MQSTSKFDDEPRIYIKPETKTDEPELYAEKDLGVYLIFLINRLQLWLLFMMVEFY